MGDREIVKPASSLVRTPGTFALRSHKKGTRFPPPCPRYTLRVPHPRAMTLTHKSGARQPAELLNHMRAGDAKDEDGGKSRLNSSQERVIP